MPSEIQTLRDHRKISLAQYMKATKHHPTYDYITVGPGGVLRIFKKRKIIGIGRNGKIAYRVDRKP
jgi:hypothetical protein